MLPALINELIVLLKETAIIGYIGTTDITKAATLVQSRTYKCVCAFDFSGCILPGAGYAADPLYGQTGKEAAQE